MPQKIQTDALGQYEALKREKEEMILLKQSNSQPALSQYRKAHENNKSFLKSDLKKTTAFVKKIRSINFEGLQQCIRDTETLNLTLYISEIVVAITETKYKATDVPSMVKLCISLHRRYEDFTAALLTNIKSVIFSPTSDDDKEFGKKKRILIRFVIELYQAGVWNDESFFVDLLRSLLGKSKGKSGKQTTDLLGLGTFVKYGCEVLFGYLPRRYIAIARAAGKQINDIPINLLISSSFAEEMKELVSQAYTQMSKDLQMAYNDYKLKEKKLEKDKVLHGTITEQKQTELENVKRLFEKLQSTVMGLCECNEFDMPALENIMEEEDENKGISVWEGAGGISTLPSSGVSSMDYGPYGDPETKAFYEDLPDLLNIVPLSALGLTTEQAQALRDSWKISKETEHTTEDDTNDIPTNPTEQALNDIDEPGSMDKEEDDESTSSIQGIELASSDNLSGDSISVENTQVNLTTLLQEKLPECINRQKVDEFCVSFCYLSTKNARKRLISSLLKIPRSRSELTANYARIIASLQRIFPDFGKPIVEALQREFYSQLRNSKPSQYLDNRIRNVRYIGELIKFGICPPIMAFRMFRAFFDDFNSQNVELVAILLETCGRYLYVLPYTRERMSEVLETILRLRRLKNLDLRLQTNLEMAYFAVKPPERIQREKVEYTMVQKYARYLIMEKLTSQTVDDVIVNIRKLPWNDLTHQINEHVTHAILHMARNKYTSIPDLADCLSGLSENLPNLYIRIVDRLFEEIQRGLDTPHKREPQSLLGFVRLLGELYNFAVLPITVIFDLLYHVINYGHQLPQNPSNQIQILPLSNTTNMSNTPWNSTRFLSPSMMTSSQYYDPRIVSDLDTPTDLFRAQIVCEVLNTCGSYYVRGNAKEKLSKFLVYFQRYLLTKSSLPMHVEFSILDTFDLLEDLSRSTVTNKKKSSQKNSKSKEVESEKSTGLVFPRYESMDEVQVAIQAIEATASDGEDEDNNDDDDDEEDDNRTTRNDHSHRPNDSITEVQANDNLDEIDDDDDDDEDEKEGNEADESVSDQNATRMLESMRAKEEDEEFEKAFKSLMQQSVESVKVLGNVKATIDINRMAIPAVLPKPKNVASRSLDDDDDEDGAGSTPRGIPFKLLGRDTKGRIETRQLLVPEEAPMVVKLLKSEAALRLEKQRLKEKVLQIESLTEQERQTDQDESAVLSNPITPSQLPILSITRTIPSERGTSGGRGYGGNRGRYNTDCRIVEDSNSNELNLDQFLEESNKAEIRKLSMKMSDGKH